MTSEQAERINALYTWLLEQDGSKLDQTLRSLELLRDMPHWVLVAKPGGDGYGVLIERSDWVVIPGLLDAAHDQYDAIGDVTGDDWEEDDPGMFDDGEDE